MPAASDFGASIDQHFTFTPTRAVGAALDKQLSFLPSSAVGPAPDITVVFAEYSGGPVVSFLLDLAQSGAGPVADFPYSPLLPYVAGPIADHLIEMASVNPVAGPVTDFHIITFPRVAPLDPNTVIPQEQMIPVPVDFQHVGSGRPGVEGREYLGVTIV